MHLDIAVPLGEKSRLRVLLEHFSGSRTRASLPIRCPKCCCCWSAARSRRWRQEDQGIHLAVDKWGLRETRCGSDRAVILTSFLSEQSSEADRSRMRDRPACAHGRRSQTGLQCRWVQRRETFVQDRQRRVLQQGAREKDPAAFAVRQLPAGFADMLHQPAWHAAKQAARGRARRTTPCAIARSSSVGGQLRPISRLNASEPDRMWFSWNCGASVAS